MRRNILEYLKLACSSRNFPEVSEFCFRVAAVPLETKAGRFVLLLYCRRVSIRIRSIYKSGEFKFERWGCAKMGDLLLTTLNFKADALLWSRYVSPPAHRTRPKIPCRSFAMTGPPSDMYQSAQTAL